MKITAYRALETVHRWNRSVGDVNGVIPNANTPVPIVVLETDSGITGIGLGNNKGIEQLFPALDGQDPRSVSALYDSMLAHCFKAGHQGAVFGTIGAIDMALWDIAAQAAEVPLWKYLGGSTRFIPGYASGLDTGLSNDELTDLYTAFTSRGFTSAKLKTGNGVAKDIERLHIVREILSQTSETPTMMIDANESWNVKQAIQTVQTIEDHIELAWVEEPVRRWDSDGLRKVSDQIRAAVATGENLTGLEQFKPLITSGAADVVQTGSVWGITHFLRVSHLAHAFQLPVSAVAYHTNPLAAASSAIPNNLGIEVQNLTDPEGIISNQEITDGGILLPDTPGSGLEIDEQAIAAATNSWTNNTGPHVRPTRAGLRLNMSDPEPNFT